MFKFICISATLHLPQRRASGKALFHDRSILTAVVKPLCDTLPLSRLDNRLKHRNNNGYKCHQTKRLTEITIDNFKKAEKSRKKQNKRKCSKSHQNTQIGNIYIVL